MRLQVRQEQLGNTGTIMEVDHILYYKEKVYPRFNYVIYSSKKDERNRGVGQIRLNS
jgi:hypothetical protein